MLHLYQSIALAPELRVELEEVLRADLSNSVEESLAVQHELKLERARLEARAKKLLDGHLDGDIPADLYRAEQRSISSRHAALKEKLATAYTVLEDLDRNLRSAFDLVENCYEAYLRASNRVRREFNQAFFESIEVD